MAQWTIYCNSNLPDSTDYTLSVPSVIFTSATTECLTFELTEDFILEGNETLTVSIVDYGGALMGPITSATITIEDNDGEKTLCSMHTRIPHCSDFKQIYI